MVVQFINKPNGGGVSTPSITHPPMLPHK